MDTEIREIFENALEAETAPQADVEALRQQWAQEAEEIRRQARADADIAAAVAGSGAYDGELLEELIRREDLTDGASAVVQRLRLEKPWLFSDNGRRPMFSAETMDRMLQAEEEQVAQRYKGNPWYRRK